VLDIGLASAEGRKGLEDRLWEMFAYAGRYGKQPLSELRGLTMQELCKFVEKVSDIVKEENKPSKGED